MTDVVLHAHELDPRRATGIARYASGLAVALREASPSAAVTLAVSAGCGVEGVAHTVISGRRRNLYARWLLTRSPHLEALVPGGPAVVHATAPILPIPTRLPAVVTIHDVLPRTHPQWYQRREISLFERSARWARDTCAAVLVPTEFVAGQVTSLLDLPSWKVHVTGEGHSHPERVEEGLETRLAVHGLAPQTYAIHVGALSDRKNLSVLLESWPADGPELIFAGPDGHGAAAIKADIDGSPRARRLGAVSDADLAALLSGARALVHPSLIEGFGLTPLEAMALGVPVIVSGAGAVDEVVGPAAARPASNDVTGWSAALELLSDDGELARMSLRGRERARAWTWAAAAEKTLAVYEAVA